MNSLNITNVVNICKIHCKKKALSKLDIIPIVITHNSLYNKKQKANICISSKLNNNIINSLIKSNALEIQISPKCKIPVESIRKYYYHTLANSYKAATNDVNSYNSLKNNIDFMNIKQRFKNEYHTISSIKHCLSNKKYRDVKYLLKSNFSTTDEAKASATVDKKEKPTVVKNNPITKPIDSYEKWFGEWKSKQKQRKRIENDRKFFLF